MSNTTTIKVATVALSTLAAKPQLTEMEAMMELHLAMVTGSLPTPPPNDQNGWDFSPEELRADNATSSAIIDENC